MKFISLLFGLIVGMLSSTRTQWGNWMVLRRERGLVFNAWLVAVGVPRAALRLAGVTVLAIALCVGAVVLGVLSTGRAFSPSLSR